MKTKCLKTISNNTLFYYVTHKFYNYLAFCAVYNLVYFIVILNLKTN